MLLWTMFYLYFYAIWFHNDCFSDFALFVNNSYMDCAAAATGESASALLARDEL